MLLGGKQSKNTHCLLRETGQLPLNFYWFRCVARFQSLEQPFDKQQCIAEKDQWSWLKAGSPGRKGSWTFEVLPALHEIPGTDVHVSAIMGRSKINMSGFELLLLEQTIREWKDLDQIHPHDAHASSRVMRTYHTHFGMPIECQFGSWDDRKRATKPTLPSYLRHSIPNHLWRALSRLRLSGHNLNIEQLRQQQHRVPYELRICTKYYVVQLALCARWRACPLRLPECWLGKLAGQAPPTLPLLPW